MEKLIDKRIKNELKNLKQHPVDGVEIFVAEGNIREWKVKFRPPPETAFANCVLTMMISFSAEYPYKPPVVTVLSPAHHPNFDDKGQVCLALLREPGDPGSELYGDSSRENWGVLKNAKTVLLSIMTLLIAPDTASYVNLDAADLYDNEYQTFCDINRTLLYYEEKKKEDKKDGEEEEVVKDNDEEAVVKDNDEV